MSEKKKEIVCHLIKVDEPTQNGRIYSKEALESAVEQFNKASKRDTCFVVKDQPSDSRILLTNVAGKIHNTELRDGQLVAQVELLDTPAGQSIQDMFFNDDVSIAPIAFGRVNDFGHVVAEDLRVLGFSFVYNPPKK